LLFLLLLCFPYRGEAPRYPLWLMVRIGQSR